MVVLHDGCEGVTVYGNLFLILYYQSINLAIYISLFYYSNNIMLNVIMVLKVILPALLGTVANKLELSLAWSNAYIFGFYAVPLSIFVIISSVNWR